MLYGAISSFNHVAVAASTSNDHTSIQSISLNPICSCWQGCHKSGSHSQPGDNLVDGLTGVESVVHTYVSYVFIEKSYKN